MTESGATFIPRHLHRANFLFVLDRKPRETLPVPDREHRRRPGAAAVGGDRAAAGAKAAGARHGQVQPERLSSERVRRRDFGDRRRHQPGDGDSGPPAAAAAALSERGGAVRRRRHRRPKTRQRHQPPFPQQAGQQSVLLWVR